AMSDFVPHLPPAGLAAYVEAVGLTIVDSGSRPAPWALMYVRREDDGKPFAALSTEGLSPEQVRQCVATAIAHSVLGHRGDFVHAPDGAILVAPDAAEAIEAVRYGELLLRT